LRFTTTGMAQRSNAFTRQQRGMAHMPRQRMRQQHIPRVTSRGSGNDAPAAAVMAGIARQRPRGVWQCMAARQRCGAALNMT